MGLSVIAGLGVLGCGPSDEEEKEKTTPPDTTPPVLTISSPTNGQEVGRNYQLSGSVTDDKSGVDKVFYNIDGGDWSEANVSGNNWSATISGLTEIRTYTNQVYAVDKAGNNSDIIEVWVNRVRIPYITIDYPVNGFSTNQNTVTATGTASIEEPASITNLQYRLNDDNWIEIDLEDESWSVELTLEEGENVLQLRAFADNGRSSSTPEWTISYDRIVFVCVTGDDGNAGTRIAPLKTIQEAISKSQTLGFDTIHVAQGTYTPGNGLKTSGNEGLLINVGAINFVGGWNTSFTSRSGRSELDAQESLYHVIWINDVNGVTIDGFIIRGGKADGGAFHSCGGGIFIDNGQWHRITNTVISDNTAEYGGGIFIDHGIFHSIDGNIFDNTANRGGGIYFNAGLEHFITASVFNNIAQEHGGGMYLHQSDAYTLDGTISNNIATNDGGGIFANQSSNIIISANIITNRVDRYGAGMHLENCDSNTISGTVSFNTSIGENDDISQGGGIRVHGGGNHTISGDIISNRMRHSGGGIYLNWTDNVTVSGNVIGNWVRQSGAGIRISYGTGHTISGNIAGNRAEMYEAGGIYINEGNSHEISGTVTNNQGRYGGGIHIRNGNGHIISGNISGNSGFLTVGGVYFNDDAENDSCSFAVGALIENNSQWGVAREDENSNPQGLDNINWGDGNNSGNVEWDDQY
jgi:hypothetical protein